MSVRGVQDAGVEAAAPSAASWASSTLTSAYREAMREVVEDAVAVAGVVTVVAPGTIAFCGTGFAFGERSEGSDTRRKGLVIPADACGAPVRLVEAKVGLSYGMTGVGGVSAWSSS